MVLSLSMNNISKLFVALESYFGTYKIYWLIQSDFIYNLYHFKGFHMLNKLKIFYIHLWVVWNLKSWFAYRPFLKRKFWFLQNLSFQSSHEQYGRCSTMISYPHSITSTLIFTWSKLPCCIMKQASKCFIWNH